MGQVACYILICGQNNANFDGNTGHLLVVCDHVCPNSLINDAVQCISVSSL